ncbi:MAG TPA: 6-bladed beta-propeller [Longimicrobiales bacterium]|nr:6-bladed beta-propeller [Longimicrobiales bacterium]
MRNPRLLAIGPLALTALAACDGGTPGTTAWAGTVDTIQSGQVVVTNPATPLWGEGDAWTVVEELRIGRTEGEGADLFGRIGSLEVDRAGRIWVLEHQSQELRVFDSGGAHIRTIGRKGGGPGEFAQAVHLQQGGDGNIWVMDPQNNRLSVYDTAGTYLTAHPALGGFVMMPWPGGFDAAGNYYAVVPQMDEEGFRVALVRYDTAFTPRDTLMAPVDPNERDFFRLTSPGGGGLMAGIPFQGGLSWRLSPDGTIWGLFTDEYRLFELGPTGDTLRTVTREFEPLAVTDEDREAARENLKWFTDQGGRVDMSRLPSSKPPVRRFFFADDGAIWVEREAGPDDQGRHFDIFDPTGRYLGILDLPFSLTGSAPIIRDGRLYGITADELGVQYVVRARIET